MTGKAKQIQITQQMIDAVFSNENCLRKFTHPKRDKAICEMRLTGTIYTDIAKRFNTSQYYCIQCVRKAERLYRVFVEGETEKTLAERRDNER